MCSPQDKPVITSCDAIWYQEVPETAQNTAEWFIMELLRVHPARTMNPDEAELFYLPILPVTSFWAKECSGTSHVQRMVGGMEMVDFRSRQKG